jgi:diguanylate cyclase (GGDEF)-like protein
MLPDAIALERAECIRQAVASVRLPLDREAYSEFSVSIGVALYPNDGETSDLLLRRADMALYRAKRSGRNQVSQLEAGALAN